MLQLFCCCHVAITVIEALTLTAFRKAIQIQAKVYLHNVPQTACTFGCLDNRLRHELKFLARSSSQFLSLPMNIRKHTSYYVKKTKKFFFTLKYSKTV